MDKKRVIFNYTRLREYYRVCSLFIKGMMGSKCRLKERLRIWKDPSSSTNIPDKYLFWILKLFGKNGLPKGVTFEKKLPKKFSLPERQVIARGRKYNFSVMKRKLRANEQTNICIKNGFAKFKISENLLTDDTIRHCNIILKHYLDNGNSLPKDSKFFQERNAIPISAQDRLRHVPFMYDRDIVSKIIKPFIDERILNTVKNYFGYFPIISSIRLLYSPLPVPGLGLKMSQFWHHDPEGYIQLKCFINLEKVDDDNGPFMFLPQDVSNKLRYDNDDKHSGLVFRDITRIDDSYVQSSLSYVQSNAGDTRDSILVDTSQCFHMGSRTKSKTRYLLYCSYTSPLSNGIEPNKQNTFVNECKTYGIDFNSLMAPEQLFKF